MALNHICKLQRMKLLLILLTVILATPMAAQVTRKKMLISFHKATTYNNAGHPDKAIATLREIAELAPMYPDTYLRMAEIYDQAGNKESAIVMYRKYINLEMDDAKIVEPSARLKALESDLGMSHYEDTEAQMALQLFGQTKPEPAAAPSSASAAVLNGGLQLFAGAQPSQSAQPSKGISSSQETQSSQSSSNGGLQLFAGEVQSSQASQSSQSSQAAQKGADSPTGASLAAPRNQSASSGGMLDLFSLSAVLESSSAVEQEEEELAADSDIEEAQDEKVLQAPIADMNGDMVGLAMNVGQTEMADSIVLDEEFLSKVYLQPTPVASNTPVTQVSDCSEPLLIYGKRSRLEEYDISRATLTGAAPQAASTPDLATILPGKWVSSECKSNGHETWIFNIALTGNAWYVSLDDRSGIYMKDATNVLNASWNVVKSLWTYDHALSNQIKDLRAKTVNARVQNEYISYTFMSEYQQKPRKNAYVWGRNILEGITDFIPFGGVVNQLGNTVINYVAEKDQQKVYTTTLEFHIKVVTPNVLRCEYVMSEKERSVEGEKEMYKKNNVCFLYKADELYDGFDFVSDNASNFLNKKLYTLLKADAEQDIDKRYPLAYMYYYGAGTSKSTVKALLHMKELADKANCDRAKAWLVPVCYNMSLDEKNSYRVVRKYYRSLSQSALNELLCKDYAYAYSLQADINISEESHLDQVVPLYKKAVSLGDVYALYRLGVIYTGGQIEDADSEKALHYLTSAAEKGYAEAYLQLALLYKRGRIVSKDYGKYVSYLFDAVEAGSVEALKELSDAYFLGMGVDVNFYEANRIKRCYMQANAEEWKEVLNVYGYNTKL